MRLNTVKAKLKAGDNVLGCFINFACPPLVELAALAGFDFVVIDAEHGPLSEHDVYLMCLAADAAGIIPIVRVPQNVPGVILRYLDVGALGLHVPQINTPEEAEAVVQAVKYQPRGSRGLAGVRAGSYGARALGEYTAQANEETLVVVHLENKAGIERLPEIMAIDGVDVVFVGTTDLTHSLGVPGQLDHPSVRQALDRTLELARQASTPKPLGVITATATQSRGYLERGFKYLGTGAGGFLLRGMQEWLGQVRA